MAPVGRSKIRMRRPADPRSFLHWRQCLFISTGETVYYQMLHPSVRHRSSPAGRPIPRAYASHSPQAASEPTVRQGAQAHGKSRFIPTNRLQHSAERRVKWGECSQAWGIHCLSGPYVCCAQGCAACNSRSSVSFSAGRQGLGKLHASLPTYLLVVLCGEWSPSRPEVEAVPSCLARGEYS